MADTMTKAIALTTQAEIEQMEFRVANQTILLKQLRGLQDDAMDDEKEKINDLVQHIMESVASAKSHKQLCEMMNSMVTKIGRD